MSTETPVQQDTKLVANKREKVGTAETRRLRKSGLTPGNVYGHKKGPVSIAVNSSEIERLIFGGARLIDIEIDGQVEMTLVRDIQWDTFSTYIVHFDLLRVDPDERVELEIPIEFKGIAPGITAGGVLNQDIRTIPISCLVVNIVDSIIVRLNNLEIGDAIRVSDLELPGQATTELEPESIVVQVVEVQELEDEEEDPLAAGLAEPEVIGQKDEEESTD